MTAYCYQFAVDGTCAFGNMCKFSHRADTNLPMQAFHSDEGPATNLSPKSTKTKKKKKKSPAPQADPVPNVQDPLPQEDPATEQVDDIPRLESKKKKKKKKKKKAKTTAALPEPALSHQPGVNVPTQSPRLEEHPTTTQSGNTPKPKKAKKKKKKKTKRREQQLQDSLDLFFAQYHPFPYNRNSPSYGEFYRMCDFFGWSDGSVQKQDARDAFKEALVLQFNSIYGTNENDPESWRKLCLALNVNPLPEGLEAMRDAVQYLHVNLVDLVDTWKTEDPVRIFGTLVELQKYALRTGKIFKKESAYAGGVLKFLLREITGTYYGSRGVAVKEKGKRTGRKKTI